MVAAPVEAEGKSVFETIKKRPLDKKKRNKNDNPDDIQGFLGPWGGYEGERRLVDFFYFHAIPQIAWYAEGNPLLRHTFPYQPLYLRDVAG